MPTSNRLPQSSLKSNAATEPTCKYFGAAATATFSSDSTNHHSDSSDLKELLRQVRIEAFRHRRLDRRGRKGYQYGHSAVLRQAMYSTSMSLQTCAAEVCLIRTLSLQVVGLLITMLSTEVMLYLINALVMKTS